MFIYLGNFDNICRRHLKLFIIYISNILFGNDSVRTTQNAICTKKKTRFGRMIPYVSHKCNSIPIWTRYYFSGTICTSIVQSLAVHIYLRIHIKILVKLHEKEIHSFCVMS